jgi:hypothetical protein
VLPNEVLLKIIANLDISSIHTGIAQIPELKSLITITLDKKLLESIIQSNNKTVSDISYFQGYQFVEVCIDDLEYLSNNALYLKLFKVLRLLLNKGGRFSLKVDYLLSEIDLSYSKMFKTLFHSLSSSEPKRKAKYILNFPNLKKVKTNSNHLLVNDFSRYQSLETLNLYYCSSNFVLEVFEYLNVEKHDSTFPALRNLKIQDYMNESEDVYLKTSDNYVNHGDYEDDDFDHNSDFDENEFYFDGLEILQSFSTFNLESLIMKNCNLSILNNMKFPNLINLKIVSIDDKHIDAYDLIHSDDFTLDQNLNDTKYIQSSFKSGLKLAIINNYFPKLKNFILIGNILLNKFQHNIFETKLDNVFIKCVSTEVDTFSMFQELFEKKNRFVS